MNKNGSHDNKLEDRIKHQVKKMIHVGLSVRRPDML
jgi:hypothetical protein